MDIFATAIEGTEKGHVIGLQGDLNEASVKTFVRFMDDFLDNHKPDAIILDCNQISSCNTEAIQEILKLYNNMRMLKKGLILSRISNAMSKIMIENEAMTQIPTYQEIDRAKEIAMYFISKKTDYDRRKLESLRETPSAMMKKKKVGSPFQQFDEKQAPKNIQTPKILKKSRTSETMKRYTTEDFTAWFKPEQSRRIRNQQIDVLMLQSLESAHGESVMELVDEICTEQNLTYNNMLPLENRPNWDHTLELVNSAKFVIIDFSTPEQSSDHALIMMVASIARLQKTEDQIILINSTEQMPVLWRDLPVIYYDGEPENLKVLKNKLTSKLADV